MRLVFFFCILAQEHICSVGYRFCKVFVSALLVLLALDDRKFAGLASVIVDCIRASEPIRYSIVTTTMMVVLNNGVMKRANIRATNHFLDNNKKKV